MIMRFNGDLLIFNSTWYFQVIPPPEWIPRRDGYDDVDINIPGPISQVVDGSQGLYTQYNIQKKSMHVKDFEKMANSDRFVTQYNEFLQATKPMNLKTSFKLLCSSVLNV